MDLQCGKLVLCSGFCKLHSLHNGREIYYLSFGHQLLRIEVGGGQWEDPSMKIKTATISKVYSSTRCARFLRCISISLFFADPFVMGVLIFFCSSLSLSATVRRRFYEVCVGICEWEWVGQESVADEWPDVLGLLGRPCNACPDLVVKEQIKIFFFFPLDNAVVWQCFFLLSPIDAWPVVAVRCLLLSCLIAILVFIVVGFSQSCPLSSHSLFHSFASLLGFLVTTNQLNKDKPMVWRKPGLFFFSFFL